MASLLNPEIVLACKACLNGEHGLYLIGHPCGCACHGKKSLPPVKFFVDSVEQVWDTKDGQDA